MSQERTVTIPKAASRVELSSGVDWKRVFFILLGAILFVLVYYAPHFPDAIDPVGTHFPLSREGKGAIAVFLLAGIWWVFEVIPIGVTSLATLC